MATKTSAAAFNSFFYQQQQQTTSQAPQQQSQHQTANTTKQMENAEVINDLHLKMSKKIAQLTKVIYALNTKNDETETIISNLKAQYDEEKEQFVLETNRKLEEYKARLLNSNDQNKKINSLETALIEYEKQKSKAIDEFESFKMESLEREESLRLNHRQEVIDMTKMLEEVKNEHQKQMKNYDSLVKNFEHEKLIQIEDLKSKHRLEIENLKQTFKSNKDSFQADNQKLAVKYESEISKLKSDLDNLNNKSQQEKQEYEQNIAKLKAFHEKELQVLKQNSSSEYEKLINSLKAELEQVNKSKIDSESQLNAKYQKKLEEIVDKENEINVLNQAIFSLQANVKESNDNLQQINKKFNELNEQNQSLSSKYRNVELENVTNKEKCEQLARNLIDKSSEISKLEASNMQNTATISDLKHQLAQTKEKLSQIEAENRTLSDHSLSTNDKNSKLIKQLEKQIDSLNKELGLQESEYKKKMSEVEETNAMFIEKLKTTTLTEKEELISKHERLLNTERANFNEKILSIQNNLTHEFNSENHKLLSECNELRSQLDTLTNELKEATRKYENETKNLKESLSKTRTELNTATKSNQELTEVKKAIENELAVNKQENVENKAEIVRLVQELEQMRILHETSEKDSQLDLKIKLDKLTKELNAKWAEQMRIECERLKTELVESKEAERRAELDNLNKLKEDELKNLKLIWQTKTNELLNEISALKRELNEKDLSENDKLAKVRHELEAENRKLNDQLYKLNSEYKAKIDELESQKSQETQTIIDNLIKQNEAKMNELKEKHLEDIRCQTLAQRSAVSSLKESLEKSKALEMDLLQQGHKKGLEMLRFELEQKYYEEMDKLKHANEKEIFAIRDELENVLEAKKKKERDYEMKVDEFQGEIRLRQKNIEKLAEEIRELRALSADLQSESSAKDKQLANFKKVMEAEIKNKETLFEQNLKEEMARLNAEHMKQKQILVNDFKQAQEILKTKLIQTETELRDLHDKYLNRPPREEDLETIDQLRRALQEKEDLLRRIHDEKKYFQMELVNRENNFNKMFSAVPNVGFINPLNANTKIKPKSNNNSNPKSPQSSFSRLEPIPGIGSPLHDMSLNPNKPLPKKFLS